MDKIEILSSHILSVENLQLPTDPLPSNRRRR